MPVAMELSRIIISEINDQQVIYLKEIDGPRTFPILIGIFEATSIDRRVKGFDAPRPLTHDLLVNSIESLGAEFQDVVISELREHTYYAKLRVRHEGELIEIDARPSDAIAVLAVRQHEHGGSSIEQLGAALDRQAHHLLQRGRVRESAADLRQSSQLRELALRSGERRRDTHFCTLSPAAVIFTSRISGSCALPRVFTTRSLRRVLSSPSSVSSSTLSER
jgi:bifunctional DNase/RNase